MPRTINARHPKEGLPADWQPDDPTPTEIQNYCQKLQSAWSDYERWKRSVDFGGSGPSQRQLFTIPVVNVSDIRAALVMSKMNAWLLGRNQKARRISNKALAYCRATATNRSAVSGVPAALIAR